MPRPPQFFTVRRGTQPRPCSSCRMTVYWIVTASGARMPVDCDRERVRDRTGADGAEPPCAEHGGRGVSHFITCVNAAQHRKRA